MRPLDLTSASGGPEVLRLVHEALARERPVVVATSGSTGAPKPVLLSMAALRTSAAATLTVIGGHGQWVAALSPERVGGLQVYLRSALSGIPPVVVATETSFGVGPFGEAVAALRPGTRRYVALVPTQVHRLLADPAGRQALAGFDHVLIGGAPMAAPSVRALDEADVRWSHTYGMTETAGGCLYDGRPLPGVRVRLEGAGETGRIQISGPMLADGYHEDPDATAEAFLTEDGRRWFRTGDLGRYDPGRARWQVLGRADDVMNTGGHKVHPDSVVSALCDLGAVADAAVAGVPDQHWGERVVALLVAAPPGPDGRAAAEPTAWARERLRASLPRHALPAEVRWVEALPRRSSGKVDKAGVRAVFAQEGETL